jgi:hypothetical protein
MGIAMLGKVDFVFEGRQADKHFVSAREFGRSLIGLDRATNVGLVLLTQGRLPHKRERFGFYLAARSPTQGSVDLSTIIDNVPWVLPLLNEALASCAKHYVGNFISWLLLWHGGRKGEATMHMDKMIELAKEVNRSHEATTSAWQSTLLSVVDRLAPTARDIVDPVGRSAGRLLVDNSGSAAGAVIDEPTADAIRTKEDIELQDVSEMRIRVDGIIRHSRTLKVEFSDQPGRFVTADVRDPVFDNTPNIYTDALGSGIELRVRARPALRGGEMFKIFVIEALS